MDVRAYTYNLLKNYDRNRDGLVNFGGGIIGGGAPEATGKAGDFFRATNPVGGIISTTPGILIEEGVRRWVDENRDGQVGLLEGIKAWFRFGINGLF